MMNGETMHFGFSYVGLIYLVMLMLPKTVRIEGNET